MMSALSRIEIKTPFDTARTFLPIDWGWDRSRSALRSP